MGLVIPLAALSLGVFWSATTLCGLQTHGGGEEGVEEAMPFEVFASFERIESGNPILACEPPEWAAAAHAMVVGDTVHYLWGRHEAEPRRWVMMHSTAAVSDPAPVEHDPRNPILWPSPDGFDNAATEYPFPLQSPADGRFYVYYLGRAKDRRAQTGLLVGDGDFGQWTRVRPTPVIAADTEHERNGSSHPSASVVGDTIHIVYTGESGGPPTICHATARTSDPAAVTKDPANPVFRGTGEAWDSRGVREAELFRGPRYFHILYGGYDGDVWRIGHVRTRDFRTFEPNPHNPVFTPASDPDAWDCDGILTPQVFEAGGFYYMLYAGKRGNEWQSGLARTRKQ